uniref:Putative steroid reductase n=1 Tax=Amblyomma aureolatum TaxID=187763 RepID=A0A1E1XCH9_9ACAR
MRSNILISCVLINIGIQWGCFVISAVLRTELLFELVGSCTCMLLALLSYYWGSSSHSLRQRVQTWLVVLWAIRLGLYLFTRKLRLSQTAQKIPTPRRRKFFLWWTLQALRILVTLFPTLLLNTSKWADAPLGMRDLAGWFLWLVGFTLEVVADHQKATFSTDPRNEGQFIRTGLWSVSRHPNYFGEILLWLGLYLSASSVFRRTEYLCVLCPVTDLLLITRITGVPRLEQAAFRKWGNDPTYHEYLRSTAVLVPFLW